MPYTRALRFQLPLIKGNDVVELQKRLKVLGVSVGQPDGIFGTRTESAVLEFQRAKGLKPDGIVGPLTWTKLFKTTKEEQSFEKIDRVREDLGRIHSYRDSIQWSLDQDGVRIGGNAPETSGGEPQTVRRVWQNFNAPINEWSSTFGVPAELIIATICTETEGDPRATRKEPKYISDEQTPHWVSVGLMQTMIATARDALGDKTIDRTWLLEPSNAIKAGTAYVASQWKQTNFDPPKVACAYNAGGIYYNDSGGNRWKMRQYPINSSAHADRFIKWFNDCFIMFKKDNVCPDVSFYKRQAGGNRLG